jgi:hypothetical protein
MTFTSCVPGQKLQRVEIGVINLEVRLYQVCRFVSSFARSHHHHTNYFDIISSLKDFESSAWLVHHILSRL